jgi:sarcosine oxidase gamma subunit
MSRPIALILAVTALDLARLGRDRLADLADELSWALVETDHRALRIGLFGVEVEHVLHAGDVLAIDLRNAPHVFAPGVCAEILIRFI